MSVALALHTTYILYTLFLCAPKNLFVLLGVPLNAPTEVIREMLLAKTDPPSPELPLQAENLLKRFNSFDARTFYIRCAYPQLIYDHSTYNLGTLYVYKGLATTRC